MDKWYDEGGAIFESNPPAINDTGKPERVFPAVSLFQTYLDKYNALAYNEQPEELDAELEVNRLVELVVDRELYDTGRWYHIYRTVYKFFGTVLHSERYLQVMWNEGSTEMQDNDEPNVSAKEVFPVSKITYE